MTQPPPDTDTGPDRPELTEGQQRALNALHQGWNPLPLPANRKSRPPTGSTGYEGVDITEEDILAHPSQWEGNLGLRMPSTSEYKVIGIDIDNYKKGQAMDNLRKRVGPDLEPLLHHALSTTWISTGRGKEGLPNGIYLFRVQPDVILNDPPKDIDFIQRHHRYIVCAPSKVYDEEAERDYVFITPEGEISMEPPSPRDLPFLPAELVVALKDRPAPGTEQDSDHDHGQGERARTRPVDFNPVDWVGKWEIGTVIQAPQYPVISSVATTLLKEGLTEGQAVDWIADNIWSKGFLPDEDSQRPWNRKAFQERVRRAKKFLPPTPDWTPGTPIPPEEHNSVVSAVLKYQAQHQPSRDALLQYALTSIWHSIIQPDREAGEEQPRFTKELLKIMVRTAWNAWQASQPRVDKDQQEEEALALKYAKLARQKLVTCPDIHNRLWRYNQDTGSYILERSEAAVISLIEAQAEADGHDVHTSLINAVLMLLKADTGIISFENPQRVAMLNGTFNLKTGKLKKHSPRHRLPTYLPVKYDRTATYEEWEQFLTEVFPDTQEHPLLQQFAGACLVDRRPPRGALFILGQYASGKSVFLNTLIALLGVWNVTAVEPQALTNTHISDALRAKKANLVNDMSIEAMKDPAKWKMLTGEDPILFNPKFKTTELGYITCPSGYAVNQIPDSWDRTGAVAVRRFIVHTAGTIPPEARDPQLTARLCENLPGIFNWAYQGYLDLLAAGWKWPMSQAQQAQQDKAVLLENSLKRWAEEETLPAEGQHIKTTEAIEAYLEWLIQEKLLDEPEERIINDNVVTGKPRLSKAERDRILRDLDNIFGQQRSRWSHGWKWNGRRITTGNDRPAPGQARMSETDPEYDKF